MSAASFEAIVLGAGPAGSAAAALLARRAHRVALVRPPRTPAGGVAQSIPPSARRLLAELGLLEAVEAARFHPNGGNTVHWAETEVRTEPFPSGSVGFHAERGELEEVLSAAASAFGAELLSGAARVPVEGPGGWSVTCEDEEGGATLLQAPWLVDATGRHGLVARTEGRVPDRSTTTLAILRRWRRRGGWEEAGTHTLLESYQDGWAWSLPLTPEVRCFTAMVDQREAELRGLSASDALSVELAKAPTLFRMLAGGEPLEEAWACPASLYTSRRFARPGLVLAGDAASCIDPLSSYGVKKALSSGWLAGVVVHTALTEPAMTATAVDYFDAREEEVYRSYRRSSAQYFEEAAGVYGHAFWTRRAEAARSAGGEGAVPDDPTERGPSQREVRAAHEALRARPRLDARAGRTLRSVRRPCVDAHRIVVADHLATDRTPRGMRWVRGVDLSALVAVAPERAAVPDAWKAYNVAAPPVSLPDFLFALSTAFAAGILEHPEG